MRIKGLDNVITAYIEDHGHDRFSRLLCAVESLCLAIGEGTEEKRSRSALQSIEIEIVSHVLRMELDNEQ